MLAIRACSLASPALALRKLAEPRRLRVSRGMRAPDHYRRRALEARRVARAMTREDLREQMETRPRSIAVHTQLICEDSDFAEPMDPAPMNLERHPGPPITQRPLNWARSYLPAASAGTEKVEDPVEPRRVSSARHEQPFNLLEPEAGVARPLVDLDPRHAFVA